MHRNRLVELDAIRGLAAFSVVLFHLTTRFDRVYGHIAAPSFALPFGHYGVQFFFGLSGFVILLTLERTRHPADFIVSRASRLYPAYWAAIAITTLFVMIGPLPDLRRSLPVILLNLTMLEGFVGAPYVDGVYWTLAIELAFYGCMFLLCLLRGLPRIEWVLVGWIGLKWLWWWQPNLSYALGMMLVQDNIPFFAIGICAYRLHSGARSLVALLPVLGLASLTIGVIDGQESLFVAILVAAMFLGVATGRMRWLRTATRRSAANSRRTASAGIACACRSGRKTGIGECGSSSTGCFATRRSSSTAMQLRSNAAATRRSASILPISSIPQARTSSRSASTPRSAKAGSTRGPASTGRSGW